MSKCTNRGVTGVMAYASFLSDLLGQILSSNDIVDRFTSNGTPFCTSLQQQSIDRQWRIPHPKLVVDVFCSLTYPSYKRLRGGRIA